MDGGKKTSDSKILAIVLGVLCALVVVLGVSLGVVISDNNKRSEVAQSENVKDEGYPADYEEIKSLLNVAEGIYNNDPNNAQKVIDYFKAATIEHSNNEQYVYAAAWDTWYFFLEKNMPEVALDGMAQMDISSLNDVSKYIYYETMANLAGELGKLDLKQEYDSLRSKYQSAFNAYEEATNKRSAEFNKELEESLRNEERNG